MLLSRFFLSGPDHVSLVVNHRDAPIERGERAFGRQGVGLGAREREIALPEEGVKKGAPGAKGCHHIGHGLPIGAAASAGMAMVFVEALPKSRVCGSNFCEWHGERLKKNGESGRRAVREKKIRRRRPFMARERGQHRGEQGAGIG